MQHITIELTNIATRLPKRFLLKDLGEHLLEELNQKDGLLYRNEIEAGIYNIKGKLAIYQITIK